MANQNDIDLTKAPAWMTGQPKPRGPRVPPLTDPRSLKRPPAWMAGSVTAYPLPSEPTEQPPPAPPIIFTPPPSMPPMPPPIGAPPYLPPVISTVPTIVVPPLPTMPSLPPELVEVLTKTIPVIAPPPSEPSVSNEAWKLVVIKALRDVASAKANSQFAAWANSPQDILTLAQSESGGDPFAEKDEGFSSKLGRHAFALGLFQMNEIWADGHYANAVSRIGASNAAKMVPFPLSAPWSLDAAKKALLAWPQQIWYPMVLLRSYSFFKNTYFDAVGGSITATSNATKLPSAAERSKAGKIAVSVRSIASTTGLPPSMILLKAYWLASSPDGVNKIVSKLDSRITALSKYYPVSVPGGSA